MSNEFLVFSCLLLLSVFIGSVSQVMLKKAAMKEYSSVLREYLNPLVIFAYVLFLGCTFLTIYSFRVVPLGFGAALEATGYIYVTIFGVFIFKEKLSFKKIIALSLIVSGVLVYAVFGQG